MLRSSSEAGRDEHSFNPFPKIHQAGSEVNRWQVSLKLVTLLPFSTSTGLAHNSVLGVTALKNLEDLPSWITENPAFHKWTERDSIKTGNGFIQSNENGNRSWLIFLNEKAGYGIQLELQKLSLNPDLNDFLLVSPWPLTADFIQIKLYTGKFNSPTKKLRIPNTKSFFVLFSASSKTASPEMALTYTRYGVPFENSNPPTENPAKRKDIVFEIQLKGKSPNEYSELGLLGQVKEALRASARRYCTANRIPFNDGISTQSMVLIHRISFCPFEWPQRQICASIEHSIFVSGRRVPGDKFILDYQLTADHLKKMWSEENLHELEELGITVFKLPSTYNTIIYWCLIISLMMIFCLTGTIIFWKWNQVHEIRQTSTTLEEVKKKKKPKLNLTKLQRIPSFMNANGMKAQMEKLGESMMTSTNKQTSVKEKFEDVVKPGESSGLPIRNYFGSILFSSNKAYEEDEDNTVELRSESPLKH